MVTNAHGDLLIKSKVYWLMLEGLACNQSAPLLCHVPLSLLLYGGDV